MAVRAANGGRFSLSRTAIAAIPILRLSTQPPPVTCELLEIASTCARILELCRPMQLSSFIRSHRDQILEAWERNAFSRSVLPNGSSYAPFRDHLGELLEAIASDMDASRPMAASPEDQAV